MILSVKFLQLYEALAVLLVHFQLLR